MSGGVGCLFVRIDVRAWSGIALELSESVTLCCNDNSLEIPIPFKHIIPTYDAGNKSLYLLHLTIQIPHPGRPF